MFSIIIICAVTIVFCLLGKKLSRTILTAPMMFIALGVVISFSGEVPIENAERTLHIVAELALIILLFLDAAQIDVMALRVRHIWPSRMLLVGLPVAIVLGTIITGALMPEISILTAALIAAILSPTDAALGQAVVSNTDVPERDRRALTVESGLNDGLALPVILLLASLVAFETERSSADWLQFGAMQIILGPIAGAAIGYLGGWMLRKAKKFDTTTDAYEGIAALAMAGSAYLVATMIGGNGFISAFVAGLFFGGIVKGRCKFVYEFTESEGQLLAWAAFLLLGIALVPDAIAHLTWPVFLIIMTSLLLIRPLAIWLSLIGTDASNTTRLFFGWFGPRGLATALFALLVTEILPTKLGEEILYLAVNTVWISALLHGITAAPGARWYGRQCARLDTTQSDTKTTSL